MRPPTRNLAAFVFVVMISTFAWTCSLAVIHGYFHQVTAIRGRVVGKSLGPFQFRWVRQSFGVASATLSLYEYRWPAKIEDLRLISSVDADNRGQFDFGLVPNGHYVLMVGAQDSELMGVFDVEVTDKVKSTDRITIDVSPIRPDCSGGHEFIENKKS